MQKAAPTFSSRLRPHPGAPVRRAPASFGIFVFFSLFESYRRQLPRSFLNLREKHVGTDLAHPADAPTHTFQDSCEENEKEDEQNQTTPFAMRTILLQRRHDVPPFNSFKEGNGSFLSCLSPILFLYASIVS